MAINEVRGDLFTAEVDAIAHGCNTVGLMGSGIAKTFHERHPQMYSDYKRLCDLGIFATGSVFYYKVKEGAYPYKAVLNLGTQELPGADAKTAHIAECFRRMLRHEAMRTYHVAIPAIGCGIGGLHWSHVKQVIEQEIEGSDMQVTAYFL